MPKRPRQAHIPSQVRRRKPRRTADFSGALPGAAEPWPGESETVETSSEAPRVGRRLAAVSKTREVGVSRLAAGQLPSFERSYLVRELKQIGFVSGSLLTLLLVLWVLMR